MQLTSNHIFLTSSTDMIEMIKPLRQIGITYFSYMKSDLQGGRVYLYSHRDVLESYLRNEYYLRGNKESAPINYQKQIVLWSTLPNQHEYDANVRVRGIDHGMFMFEPGEDSLEAFAFAADSKNERIINTYLTKLDYLKNFTSSFKENAASLITKAEKSKIILPFHNSKINFIHNDTPRIDCRKSRLSSQQRKCLLYLTQGLTIKGIAAKLKLSPRTVEHYLEAIKIKLNCCNKAELYVKASELGII